MPWKFPDDVKKITLTYIFEGTRGATFQEEDKRSKKEYILMQYCIITFGEEE